MTYHRYGFITHSSKNKNHIQINLAFAMNSYCLRIPLRSLQLTIESRDIINWHALAMGMCIQSVIKTIGENSAISHAFM